MPTTSNLPRTTRRRPSRSAASGAPTPPNVVPSRRDPAGGFEHGAAEAPKRMASNFAALSVAEILCRAISMVVMLGLAQRLGAAGYGRIELAFNIVLWLVLLVREGLDVIATREIARHPRLIRPLVNHILALRLCLAGALLVGLVAVGVLVFSGATERLLLGLYGLLLLTTAIGLDFVYRGLERMGLVAVSLMLRTSIYALGVGIWVTDPSRIVWVPVCLVIGELSGIALVWFHYVRGFGLPRPSLRAGKTARTILRRGRPVYLIQVAQAVIASADLLVVGLMSQWTDVGLYGAPHRMVTAVLTFGVIFRQVVFPTLARTWRASAEQSREALEGMVGILMIGLVPIAAGGTMLADPLVELLLGPEYQGSGPLLAVCALRIPLLTVAFLYQAALIALNREAAGVRMLIAAAASVGPLAALLRWQFGLIGAACSVVIVGFVLLALGHRRLSREGRAPARHHQVFLPIVGSLAMLPVALGIAQWHVLPAILGGAATYLAVLWMLGGLDLERWKRLLAK